MKVFLIFCISFLVGVNCKFYVPGSPEPRQKQVVEECARELNVDDESKYIDNFDFEASIVKEDKEATCVIACANRKIMSETYKGSEGSDDRETLYNGLMNFVDETYKKAGAKFETELPRADVVNKVDECYATAKTECDFFECIQLYTSETFVELYLQSILNDVQEVIDNMD